MIYIVSILLDQGTAFASQLQDPCSLTRRPMLALCLSQLTPRRRLLAWGRSLFALAVVAVLLVLGVANIAHASAVAPGRGRRAVAGAPGRRDGRGSRGGVACGAMPASQRGDVLMAVNGSPIERPADVIAHRATQRRWRRGSRTRSTVSAPGRRSTSRSRRAHAAARCISCWRPWACSRCSSARPSGCVVRTIRRRCISSGCASRSSASSRSRSTVRFDRLDWVFYWGDAVAMVLLPPLLLRFHAEFPERPARSRSGWSRFVPLVYVPALALGAARVIVVTRGVTDGQTFSRAIDALDRADHVYLVPVRHGGVGRAGARVRADYV